MAPKKLSMLIMSVVLALPLLLPVTIVLSSSAEASNKRPRPQPQRCFSLAKKIGANRVWWGRHVGSRDLDPMFSWGPKKEYFNDIGCFKTKRECENWLYWMRTDFPHSTYYKPCRRGL